MLPEQAPASPRGWMTLAQRLRSWALKSRPGPLGGAAADHHTFENRPRTISRLRRLGFRPISRRRQVGGCLTTGGYSTDLRKGAFMLLIRQSALPVAPIHRGRRKCGPRPGKPLLPRHPHPTRRRNYRPSCHRRTNPNSRRRLRHRRFRRQGPHPGGSLRSRAPPGPRSTAR